MPKFAANITFLFTELDFHARFQAAAEAGFPAVEHQFPHHYRKEDLAEWLQTAGLQQALINMPAGDWENGERGTTCLPGREAEFQDGIGTAVEYAQAIGCPTIHVVAGLAPAGGPERAAYEDTYRRNLAWAADAVAPHNLTLSIEPINGKRDVPGFFLQTTDQALAIMDEIDKPNVKLQFDVYHVQIMEGDLIHRFRACVDRVGHVQIANPPDRHEPDHGEINYPRVLSEIDAAGYTGWIGCEYKPRAGTREGLGWGRDYGLKTG